MIERKFPDKPLCIDLYCGLGGWTEAFIAEGYECIGFDIEAHDYGTGGYPGELRIRDVRSIHGSELKDATCIVGSSPCQEFSYRAMPWKRAKALPPPYLGIELFNAQFRIQREAIEAAGHYIPMVVENVRGAQKWVGRAPWHYGSFYLWGDVPALMPFAKSGAMKGCVGTVNGSGKHREQSSWDRGEHKIPGFRFDGSGKSFQTASVEVLKGIPHRPAGHWTNSDENGTKEGGDWWNKECRKTGMAQYGSKSSARKRASAMIAKIPMPLAQWIARCYYSSHESNSNQDGSEIQPMDCPERTSLS